MSKYTLNTQSLNKVNYFYDDVDTDKDGNKISNEVRIDISSTPTTVEMTDKQARRLKAEYPEVSVVKVEEKKPKDTKESKPKDTQEQSSETNEEVKSDTNG